MVHSDRPKHAYLSPMPDSRIRPRRGLTAGGNGVWGEEPTLCNAPGATLGRSTIFWRGSWGRVCGWDVWVCGLGAVGASSIFGLVRRAGAFTGGILTFDLVSGLQLPPHNRDKCQFSRAAFPSQLETMFGVPFRGLRLSVSAWVSVGRSSYLESHTRPSHSCDGCVCDLGVVGVPLIFGLTRRTGDFPGGLLTFALVSGFQLAQHNRGKYHFFREVFSSQLEAMVGGALTRTSDLHVDLGVGGTTIASG